MISIMSDWISLIFECGRKVALKKDETLFQTGEPVRYMYNVIDGKIDLVRHSKFGSAITLHRTVPNQILAEASAYSNAYHCDAVASEPSECLTVPISKFHDKLNQNSELSHAWASYLAHSLQRARFNAEIRTLRTVAARLDAWLSIGNQLPPKGEWQFLASVLGVTPAALYRELSNRRK